MRYRILLENKLLQILILSLSIVYPGYTVAQSNEFESLLADPPRFTLDALFRVGTRNDKLNWNIASDFSGTFTPNVLSELSWEAIESIQATVDLSGTVSNRMYFRLSIALAAIQSGRNQDSDYNGNNRTLEFSRSTNETSNGRLADVSGGLGYIVDLNNPALDWLRIVPMVGYSYHRQYLWMTNGEQTVASIQTPPLGPILGLDSRYEAQWYGLWAGLEMEFDITPWLQLEVMLEHHRGDYLGIGNWNLRSDFKHPRSFEHIADATGEQVSMTLRFTTDSNWQWLVSANYQKWRTSAGIDRIFFFDNTIAITRLNKVNWQSSALSLGIYRPF